MQARLASILTDTDYHTMVVCDGEEIVGFVGARIGLLYESDDSFGQIMALAVAKNRQRSGVGLVQRGARVFVVTSGNHRAGAHAFYEKNGYRFTGRSYKKSIAGSPCHSGD
jgi:ribosomal protein S18 acetylase RimI-like enzyme